MENEAKPDALIVAAGTSSRCSGYKPLYKWRDKYLIEHIIENAIQVCGRVVIVTGYNAELLESTLTSVLPFTVLGKIDFVHNRNYRRGMFSSLQAGCSILQGKSWALYQFTDQPSLPLSFYDEFISQITSDMDWVQPIMNEKKGHPLLLSPTMQGLIKKAKTDMSLKELGHLPGIRKKYWECRYPEIHLDIDTDEEWESFIRQNN